MCTQFFTIPNAKIHDNSHATCSLHAKSHKKIHGTPKIHSVRRSIAHFYKHITARHLAHIQLSASLRQLARCLRMCKPQHCEYSHLHTNAFHDHDHEHDAHSTSRLQQPQQWNGALSQSHPGLCGTLARPSKDARPCRGTCRVVW